MGKTIEKYDVIVVGTGFATSFFLLRYLQKAGPKERILVLERGRNDSHEWQLRNGKSSSIPYGELFVNLSQWKRWVFSPGFGGSSKIWWGCTPRFMPNDFKLKTIYGIGKNWPLSYDDLEEYYCKAEDIMSISGPDNSVLFPRSKPYPQPPHLLSDPDKILQKAYPHLYFAQPTARTSVGTANRNICCAAGVCDICPVDAKFTVLNELEYVYNDPRINLLLGAKVNEVKTQGDIALSVDYHKNGESKKAWADLIVLGANSLFNPYILLRSGFEHPMLGKNLNEQISKYVTIELAGVDSLQGSTSITSNGYMHYDGDHRFEYAGCLIESYNVPHINGLRMEKGKWRQRMKLKFIFEDIPDQRNFLKINDNDPNILEVMYVDYSDYTKKAIEKLPEILPNLLSSLPVEEIKIGDYVNSTDGHIMGTTVMGNDPKTSVVDKHLKHHRIRNLLILGSGTFPTCPPANPALTISALSMWAADHL